VPLPEPDDEAVSLPGSARSRNSPASRKSMAVSSPVPATNEFPTPSVARPPAVTTPESLEAQSIALAWQLQQEEQAAFQEAISAHSPAPGSRSSRRSAPAVPDQTLEQMEAEIDDEDASVRLALQLQQEELQWQQFQSRRAVAAAMGTPIDSPHEMLLPHDEEEV